MLLRFLEADPTIPASTLCPSCGCGLERNSQTFEVQHPSNEQGFLADPKQAAAAKPPHPVPILRLAERYFVNSLLSRKPTGDSREASSARRLRCGRRRDRFSEFDPARGHRIECTTRK